jgi:hypothetical protein
MATVYRGRYTADLEGDFVVFIIGMRFNKPWKVHKWLPVFLAMRPMLKRLDADAAKGLLGARFAWIGGPASIQYWRDFQALEGFARDRTDPHLPAWRRFNRAVGASGDVGIWHETYQVKAGAYEVVYGNMPRSGLAAARTAQHVPVGRKGLSAARRIGARETDEAADVPAYAEPAAGR